MIEKQKEGFIGKALRKPSAQTQLEATIVGITIMLLASLTSCVYVLFFSNYGLFWKIVTGLGEIGILLMMLSSLATTYIQLYALKVSLGLMDGDSLMNMINQLSGQTGEKREGKPRRKKKGREISQSIPENPISKDFTKETVENLVPTVVSESEKLKEEVHLGICDEVKDDK